MDPLATRARASRTAAWKGISSCAPEARARRETHRSSWLCERLRAEAATDGGESGVKEWYGPGIGLLRVPAVRLPSPFMTPFILLSRRRPSVSKAHGSWVSARGRDLLNISWWASSSLEPVVVDVVVDAILALARPCPEVDRGHLAACVGSTRVEMLTSMARAPSDSSLLSLDDEFFFESFCVTGNQTPPDGASLSLGTHHSGTRAEWGSVTTTRGVLYVCM